MLTTCPHCQTANPPAARFCRTCGEPCAPPVAPEEVKPAAASDPLAFATDAGRVSLGETIPEEPAVLAVLPAVSDVGTPEPPPLVEPTADEEPSPLVLSLNFSHVLIAGHSTTFEMRLSNRSGEPLEKIQVRLESRGLKEAITKSIRRLGPEQQTQAITLEIDPARPGRNLLRCTVRLHARAQEHCYVGERDIAINNLPDNLQSLSINIQDIMSNGGGGANANLGAEYGDVNISNLLGSNVLRSLNDLINLELPARFLPVALALDYEISERAPAPQPSSEVDDPGSGPAKHQPVRRSRIPDAFLKSAQGGGLLRMTPTPAADGKGMPLQLVARGEFRLGRSRPDVDFVTWFLPRSAENDARTKRLSRFHVLLTLRGEHLLASIPRPSGGDPPRASIDSQEIRVDQPLAVGGRAALGLGSEYFLDVMPFSASESAGPHIANLVQWVGRASDRQGGRGGCVRLLPLACAESLWQSVWMFTEAAFGANRCNPIILPSAGLEEIQGRFVYYRGSFWLEKSVTGGLVEIDGTALKAGDIVPLVTGQTVRLGEIEYRTEVRE